VDRKENSVHKWIKVGEEGNERVYRYVCWRFMESEVRMGWKRGLLRNVTGAGTWKFVGINEESSVRVTRVYREHPVVDILLGTLALVAGSQQAASRVRVLTSLKTGGLCVVVVSITITLRNVLQDDSPVALNIDSSGDLGIVYITGTKITLRSDPVGGIIGRGSLASTSVVRVVKPFLLGLGDVLDQIISRLVSNVGILL